VQRASLAFCLALLLPVGAAAQPVDAENAQLLQHDLQHWFGSLLGPNLGAQEQRLRVSAEDDHFRVALPFDNAAGDAEITANVRPLEAGRWSIDALRLPSPAHFTLMMPEANAPHAGKVPTDFALTIGRQHAQGIIDPALATPSNLDIDLDNLDLASHSRSARQEQHIDRYVLQTTLRPRDGRLDLHQQGTIAGWRSASRIGDKPATAFGADTVQLAADIDGIDHAHAAELLTAVGGLLATLPPTAAAERGDMVMTAPERAALRALILSLRGLISRLHADETIDGMHVAIAGRGEATLRHVHLGIDGAAPDGMLHAGLTVAVDGIAVQDLPPAVSALVPQHVALRPVVAGVSMSQLTSLALEATNQDVNHAQLQADAAALLSHGGVTIGLETLDVDLGPAQIRGHGSLLVTGPDAYELRAHLTATGFDGLMQQARDNPDLARALPMLAVMRGFARPEGDHLLWDVQVGSAGLTVNGIPLGNPAMHEPHPDRR
jgi:hypothetical protein